MFKRLRPATVRGVCLVGFVIMTGCLVYLKGWKPALLEVGVLLLVLFFVAIIRGNNGVDGAGEGIRLGAMQKRSTTAAREAP